MNDFRLYVEDGRWPDGGLRIAWLALPRRIASPKQTVECFGFRASSFLGRLPLAYPHVVIFHVAIYPVVIAGSCVRNEP